ncbi:hypothetical protein ACVXZY_09105 [Staphylococcus aureus]
MSKVGSCTNKVATLLKGYVKYHNDDEQNVEYDFYNLNGEYGYEVLKMYADKYLSIETNCI